MRRKSNKVTVKELRIRGTVRLGAMSGYVWIGDLEHTPFEEIDRHVCSGMLKRRDALMETLAKQPRGKVDVDGEEVDRRHAHGTLASINAKLARYKPIAERRVLDVYRSCYTSDTIVIIEGQEVGKYWTAEEMP